MLLNHWGSGLVLRRWAPLSCYCARFPEGKLREQSRLACEVRCAVCEVDRLSFFSVARQEVTKEAASAYEQSLEISSSLK